MSAELRTAAGVEQPPRGLDLAFEHFRLHGTVRTAAKLAGVPVREMFDLLLRRSIAERQAAAFLRSLPKSPENGRGGE